MAQRAIADVRPLWDGSGVPDGPMGFEAGTVGPIPGRPPLPSMLLTALLAALLIARIGMAGVVESRAVPTIGFVLAEALILYVGYGALMRVTAPAVHDRLVRA